MHISFGNLLAKALMERGLSQREFARLVHAGRTLPNQVITGKRRPPLDQIERWAGVLEITGTARDEFIFAANIEHTPAKIRDYILRLEKAQKGR